MYHISNIILVSNLKFLTSLKCAVLNNTNSTRIQNLEDTHNFAFQPQFQDSKYWRTWGIGKKDGFLKLCIYCSESNRNVTLTCGKRNSEGRESMIWLYTSRNWYLWGRSKAKGINLASASLLWLHISLTMEALQNNQPLAPPWI